MAEKLTIRSSSEEIEVGEACRKELRRAEEENRLLGKLLIDKQIGTEVNRELSKKVWSFRSNKDLTFPKPQARQIDTLAAMPAHSNAIQKGEQ